MSVICCLSLLKPPLKKKSVQYRKLSNVNISALREDLRSSSLFSQTHSNTNELVESFNTTLSKLLEIHAPLLKKNITTRPHVPWFSDEIKAIKRRRRKAEKLWRKTNKESDLMQFKFIKNKANHLMHRAKCDFYTRIVNENSHNQSKLFSIAKNLLTPKKNLSFSDHQDKNCLVNELGQYFISKIDTIRSQFNSNDSHTSTSPSTSPATSPSTSLSTSPSTSPSISPSTSPSTSQSTSPSSPSTSPSTGPSNLCRLLNFAPLSEDDVQKLISNTGKKYCALDPMTTQSRSQSMPVRGLVVGKALAKRNFPVRFCTVHACSLMILIKSLSTFIAGLQSMFHDHRDLCKIHVTRKYIYLIVFRWNDLSVSFKDNM